VENFVQSTRRRYDRGNPRDAGELYACQMTNILREQLWEIKAVFLCEKYFWKTSWLLGYISV